MSTCGTLLMIAYGSISTQSVVRFSPFVAEVLRIVIDLSVAATVGLESFTQHFCHERAETDHR